MHSLKNRIERGRSSFIVHGPSFSSYVFWYNSLKDNKLSNFFTLFQRVVFSFCASASKAAAVGLVHDDSSLFVDTVHGDPTGLFTEVLYMMFER